MRLFASAPPALVPLLQQELMQLAVTPQTIAQSGITFDTDMAGLYRTILWSRLANRILLPIATLPATSAEELYRESRALHWERHLHSSGTLAIDVIDSGGDFNHSHFATLTVKDAIVDRFRELFGERPTIELDRPDLRLQLLLQSGRVKIALDLSGGSLHRRGYRLQAGEAPLKENLAAALLLTAEWPQHAAAGGSLVDPLCGSGTLLIEAALIASQTAPALHRPHFGFSGWKKHQPDLWQSIWAEAEAARRPEPTVKLYGFDLDAPLLQRARDNAERAGVADWIEFETADLLSHRFTPPTPTGLLITNPPYGDRLGFKPDLLPIYRRLGELVRTPFQGWHFGIISSDESLYRATGCYEDRPFAVQNGAIACQFHYHQPTLIELTPEAVIFKNRLLKRVRHLAKWAKRQSIHSYRLYDADLPDFALAIDRYQTVEGAIHIVVQEYQAPKEIPPHRAEERLLQALSVIRQELQPTQLHLKTRKRQRGSEQYQRQQQLGEVATVRECGVQLEVNLSDYLDTGLFLDHRPLRCQIGQLAAAKRFLNLFAYTGSATVHAACGGATTTTSVDLSATYLAWAERNLILNGHTSPYHHQLIQRDVMEWLHEQNHRPRPPQYDLIFIDPPTFSNSKRTESHFDIQSHHPELLALALPLLAPDGLLLFSTNFRHFRLEASVTEAWACREITPRTVDEDFQQRRPHRCWEIRRP